MFEIGVNTLIHPTAEIHKTVSIGDNCIIGPNTVIKRNVEIRNDVKIGAGCYIDSGVIITGKAEIGNNVTLRNYCIIARGTKIGDNSFLAPQCMFQNLPFKGEKSGGAEIGANCKIGTNVTFKEGIKVCNNVVIGTKAYVNKDIVEQGTYMGIPAIKVK